MARAHSDSLQRYRQKRDVERTPEPAGEVADGDGRPRFVVQRHRARRLHYDFRLEIGGVLVSWAVPKGLTLDPRQRHLAVRVEDHPLAYADFEGVIPRGEYGGGDVIVWDRGTWDLHRDEDPMQALADGELHLELFVQPRPQTVDQIVEVGKVLLGHSPPLSGPIRCKSRQENAANPTATAT